jgi:hypothetical protein
MERDPRKDPRAGDVLEYRSTVYLVLGERSVDDEDVVDVAWTCGQSYARQTWGIDHWRAQMMLADAPTEGVVEDRDPRHDPEPGDVLVAEDAVWLVLDTTGGRVRSVWAVPYDDHDEARRSLGEWRACMAAAALLRVAP